MTDLQWFCRCKWYHLTHFLIVWSTLLVFWQLWYSMWCLDFPVYKNTQKFFLFGCCFFFNSSLVRAVHHLVTWTLSPASLRWWVTKEVGLWWGQTGSLLPEGDAPLHPHNTSELQSCRCTYSHPEAPLFLETLTELNQLLKWEENEHQKQRAYSDGSDSWISSTVSLKNNVRKRVRVLVGSRSKRRRKEREEKWDGICQQHQANRGSPGRRQEDVCDASVSKYTYPKTEIWFKPHEC